MGQFNMTPEQYAEHMKKFPGAKKENVSQEKELPGAKQEKKHKYHASPKEERTYNGIIFDSKKEMFVYQKLELAVQAGEILYFLRQVPIRFKCGSTYWVDFLVFYNNGTFEYIEAKGVRTPVYKTKLKLLADEYPHIQIQEV